MSNELVAYSDIERMGKAMADSRFFGVMNATEAVALMLIAQAEGLHPAIAMRDYHVINGRPALKADAMLARFQQQGGIVEWEELSDRRVAARFSHPKSSPKPVLIEWTDATVQQAQLGGNHMHKKYPRQMKRARVISEGIRTVYPACVCGFYTPEEVEDFAPPPPVKRVDVTDKKPATSGLLTQEELKADADGFDRPRTEHPRVTQARANIEGANKPKLAHPQLDGVDFPPVSGGNPDREVIIGLKGGRKTKRASDLTNQEIEQFFACLRFRWDSWKSKPDPKWGEKNKQEMLDECAAVLAAEEMREQLSAQADGYATTVSGMGDAAPPAPADDLDADVITANTKIFYGVVAGKRRESLWRDMSDEQRRDALDAAKSSLADPNISASDRARNRGIVNFIESKLAEVKS